MEQVFGLQSGGESRQDVVQNDRFSLGGIGPEGGASMYQKGASMYQEPITNTLSVRSRYQCM